MGDHYFDSLEDELSWEDMMKIAEKEAQANLGISFQEFRTRWFRGEYANDPRPEVTGTAFWIDLEGNQ